MSAKKKELLSETAYRAIKNMILTHRFAPGLRVNVEKLGRELGVSRPPVWEAIRRLEQEGVLRKIPNRGVFMIENTLERLFEQVQIRGSLDALAGALACKQIDARILVQLSRCLTDQLQAIENANLNAYSAADLQFHQLIYEASGNVALKAFFESISLQMTTVPRNLNILPRLPSTFATHQEMIEGLTDRNEDLVQAAVGRHTEIILAHLEAEIRARIDREEAVQRIKHRLGAAASSAEKKQGS